MDRRIIQGGKKPELHQQLEKQVSPFLESVSQLASLCVCLIDHLSPDKETHGNSQYLKFELKCKKLYK